MAGPSRPRGWLLAGLLAVVTAPILAASHDAAPAPETSRSIAVSADRARELAAAFAQSAGRPPTAAERDGLIAGWVEREMLFREAVARGLDRDLVLVRYALDHQRHDGGSHGAGGNEGQDRDESALERALARGLDPDDPNVRGYLIAKMKRVLLAEGGPIAIAEDELRDAFAARRGRHSPPALHLRPARQGFVHVFLSRDRRGASLDADARSLLARLARDRPRPSRAAERGDLFLGPSRLEPVAAEEITRLFGPRFAAALELCPPRAWCGPIRSTYGLHLVWVTARLETRPATFREARDELRRELVETRRAARLEAALERLRRGYSIHVEPADGAAR